MRDEEFGRAFRLLRHRRGWRQVDIAARRRLRMAVGQAERGRLERLPVATLRSIADVLGARMGTTLDWQGSDLRRLLDADHAALPAVTRTLLEGLGWLVRVEVTFNHYGDRGSVDLLAFHPPTGILLVIEIKTLIVDVQALLASLDTKPRVAGKLATDLGWHVRGVVPMIVLLEGTTNRRRLAAVESLFADYSIRGHDALRWLRAPSPGPAGLLRLAKLPDTRGGDARRAGRQRVRVRRGQRPPPRAWRGSRRPHLSP